MIYTGSIRLANNIKSIVDAAFFIQRDYNSSIEFLIYGDGNDRKTLEHYCEIHNIKNVKFKGFVEKKKIPYVLSKSNLNILHFEQNNLKKYGASLNKMFEYFASGKPTLSDCEFSYDLIKKYKCGIVVDKAEAEQLAEAVIQFYNMPLEEYQLYSKNAKKAAKEYSFKVLSEKLEKLI
ncbi:glycosyltransferase [Sinobaca sp. H24]|uniref:glycosyltransferase n=1 Tax=Sinobaca sp. H24 TaxID=2923376 RepID=UPI002079335E|nr:glycosyltransferase [Sinobaca sp. H24]